ncbi:Two pore calcium channel protein 1, variant 2 [Dermatophagoides farinae]|uniref:Two pore calcium channel protein 1, variant 2 n=1 Tax=Dermatophagoides farinae TaxID=6954 RepID=A0A922HZW9_DERFA|nr:Two pore calcium channel protein 1, variant 2 [Dermatophagoides farinae]
MNVEEYLHRHHHHPNHNLTLDKFYHIYEVLNLHWENLYKSLPWFDRSRCCFDSRWFPNLMYRLRAIVLHRYFDWSSYIVIIMAALYQFFDAIIGWNANHVHRMFYFSTSIRTICAIFISLYTIEMLLKLSAFGPREYFRRRWNPFDFIITIISLIIFMMNEYLHVTTTTTITLSTSFFSFRSLKLLNLLRRHVHRYRDILGPFALIIIKRFMSVTMVVLIVYYFFAIIAMECFGQYSLIDCCQNSTLEPYYRSNGTTASFYYLNNFQDLITSYITLFELMVVNNWQITMSAYVIAPVIDGHTYFSLHSTSLHWSSSLLSFQYKHRFGPDDSMSVQISVEVPFNQQEFNHYQSLDKDLIEQRPSMINLSSLDCGWCSSLLMDNNFSSFDYYSNKSFNTSNPSSSPISLGINENVKDFETFIEEETNTQPSNTTIHNKRTIMFCGRNICDKFSYNLRMYHDELEKWINQSEYS